VVRKMLLAIFAVAAVPACAPAGQRPQSVAPVATVAGPQRGLSPELRQRIRRFVARHFREEGIGRDLLEGTLAGIDRAAGRPPIGVGSPRSRAIRAYPSVATQVSWQRSLGRIAGEFRLAFPSRYRPQQVMIRVEGQIDPIPATEAILWTIPDVIERAQGTFSQLFYVRPISELPGRPSGIRRAFAGWTGPLRINVRRVAGSEEAVGGALARLRAMHPEGLIDNETYPSAAETANVFIAPQVRDWGTVDAVFACLGMRCLSLHDAAFGYGRVDEPLPAKGRADALFFDRLYLTNPYGYLGTPSALIQVDGDGHIVSAFCGAGDVGFGSAGGAVRTDAEARLLSCLNEVISPGSTREPPLP
jgi:hypothetical protein